MLSRRSLLGLFSGAAVLMSVVATAAAPVPYSQAAFNAAAAAGQPILIEITAPWCPTCRAQKPILDALLQKPQFKAMAVFQVDFDSQKAVVRAFGADLQSTLIVFKGDKAVGRSVGDTSPQSIAALLARAA